MNSKRPVTPAKHTEPPPRLAVKKPEGNGYTPKFTAPAEPTVAPPPKAGPQIDLPDVLETTTLSDLVARITDNATVLYPGDKPRVTTAVSSVGNTCHALVMGMKNPDSPTSRYKVLFRGPGIVGNKKHPAQGRRDALVACLEELERKVGKEFMSGPGV